MQPHSSRTYLALAALLSSAAIAAQQKSTPAAGMPRTVKSTPAANGVTYVPQIPPLPAASTSELRDLVSRYSTDRSAVLRRFSVQHSDERRDRLREFHDAWLAQLGKVTFDKLSQEGKVDYLLLGSTLTYELRLLDRDRTLTLETEPLLPFAKTVNGLHEARRRMETMEPRSAAAALDSIDDQINRVRRALESGLKSDAGPALKTTRIVALRASEDAAALRQTLQQWFRYYNGYDPLFTWWNDQPFKRADKALEGYVAFLRERIVGAIPDQEEPIVGDPIGREALLIDLEREMIPYTPEELLKIGEKEYGWCVEEAKKASREMGLGDDWKAALERVKNIHVEPGRQTDLIRDLAFEAIDFVERNQLVTVPALARDIWRIEMIPPERQRVSPFFLGGEVIQVSYPTAAMDHADKMMSMRGNALHFSRATVQHELIPGHHLQGFMTDRYSSHRAAFATPFWGEGWALYWEMLLWDKGFAKSPEDRIGMLFWRMHRAARIVFSIGFHLGKMTPQEAIDYLVEKVGHERFTAEGEVRRSFNGTYSPLYQVAYLIGGRQFRALHRELVDSGRMTDRAFHDAVLQRGRMPVEMVRASLTPQPLTRDYRARWRFYGELEKRAERLSPGADHESPEPRAPTTVH
jgi:uncharacterized protein (DUF885 family)